MSKTQNDAAEPLSDLQKARIRTTLERVLASPAFRKSDQCQRFLRYVVEHSCGGHEDLLKEGTIGIEVFGREAAYDRAEDPVVRVRATEVRKRLSQYYGEWANEEDVRFEIPSGSYRVEFRWAPLSRSAAAIGAAAPAKSRWRWLAWPLGAAALLGGITALVVWRAPSPPTVADQFWAPAYESGKPVLLYCGQPVVYFLSQRVREQYRLTLPADKQRGSYPVTLAPDAALKGSDIIPVTEQFVGIGNAHTAAMLAALMAAKRKPVEIRYANDVSFSDLRGGPSVLIGAFSNQWTLEMQGQSRFVFEQDKAVRRIRDNSDNRTWQLADLAPDGKTPEDYAIVSRLFHSGTGHLLVSAAGITQYGTRAAGEFLTAPALLNEAARKWPSDWPAKNLQVLLHTTIYRGTPATPTVVATHVW